MDWLLEDGTSNSVSLKDALHVPGLTCGLFSISQATCKGLDVMFSGDNCKILRGKKVIGTAPKTNNADILNASQPTAKVAKLIQ